MPTWPTDSLSSGFVYVRETEPENPEEGETWYDLNANEAKVYDGGVWHLLTVTEHSEIGGVSAGQHRSDSNIRSTVDGAVDADTVDGQHASELGGDSVSFWRKSVRETLGDYDDSTVSNTTNLPSDVIPLSTHLAYSGSSASGTIDYTDGTEVSVSPGVDLPAKQNAGDNLASMTVTFTGGSQNGGQYAELVLNGLHIQ